MHGVHFDAGVSGFTFPGGRELPVGFAYVYQQKDADRYETDNWERQAHQSSDWLRC
jgi:hypothetical protein